MPLRSIINTARTLSYYTRLQEVVANNLANASTDGYKADRVTARLGRDGMHPIPVQALDLRQGTLRDTGRPLDIALKGDGFLVVQTPQGERLMRGGSMSLSADGTLVDRNGDPVLGAGGPIQIRGKTVEITGDGVIVVDGAKLDQLRLETVDDPTTLSKEGAGRFVAANGTRPATDLRVAQGTIEDANVDSLLGTVDMIMIQRSYAANIDALKAMDAVLGTVTNDIGRV